VTRIAILRNAAVSSGPAQFGIVQAAASSFRMEVNAVNMGDAADIERGLAAFARTSNGDLIVTANPAATIHRELIVTLVTLQFPPQRV
jgi:hypothetical protein